MAVAVLDAELSILDVLDEGRAAQDHPFVTQPAQSAAFFRRNEGSAQAESTSRLSWGPHSACVMQTFWRS